MTLGELIKVLREHDPSQKVQGFGYPHSYRGYFDCLAFEPMETTVRAMLKCALKSNGKSFHGYKGGVYKMDEDTPVYLADHGNLGELITEDMLDEMLTETGC